MLEHRINATASLESEGPLPPGLMEAFWRYERALMADDADDLDRLFAPGPATLRGDTDGLLVGHDRIAAFRRARGGAPNRRIAELHVRPLNEKDAVVVAVLAPVGGGRGQQTQVWRRGAEGWQIVVAQVSGPTAAVDPRIWRIAGAPFLAPTADGPLRGERVAVKDLFAIAGQVIGAGVPARLTSAPAELKTASAVQALLDAGAEVAGIARTDEFAYSIAGANPHYGAPPNAAVPGALPGGSSSGPASAVASEQATIGLATDTGGSIRVPASYQGLWGLRTTHGLISREGLLPLAPTFDTVGWLTRTAATLRSALMASIPVDRPEAQPAARLATAPALLEPLDRIVRQAQSDFLDRALASGFLAAPPDEVDLGDVDQALDAFRTVQAYEAWQVHGAWLADHPGAVSGAVADRFRIAAAVSEADARAAGAVLATHRARFTRLLEERTLVLPSAASVAPPRTAPPADLDRVRAQTLRLTCIAGVAGAPALSVPVLTVNGAPLGLCLVGRRGGDARLIALAQQLVGPGTP